MSSRSCCVTRCLRARSTHAQIDDRARMGQELDRPGKAALMLDRERKTVRPRSQPRMERQLVHVSERGERHNGRLGLLS